MRSAWYPPLKLYAFDVTAALTPYYIAPFLVLSEPMKRHIYDVYGKKGLEADWQVSILNILSVKRMFLGPYARSALLYADFDLWDKIIKGDRERSDPPQNFFLFYCSF